MNHHIDTIFNEMIDDVRYIEICSKVYTGINMNQEK